VTETRTKDVVKMVPHGSYQLWQAERSKTDAERRQTDAELGMLIAEMSCFVRDVTGPMRAVRRHRLLRHLEDGRDGLLTHATHLLCIPYHRPQGGSSGATFCSAARVNSLPS
jgi:hypothetical protein